MRFVFFLLLAMSVPLGAQAPDAKAKKAAVPALAAPALAGSDAWGHPFVWQDGTKIPVTDPWEFNVLGGGAVSGDKTPVWHLWGWTVEPPRVRFWTLELELGKPAKEGEALPVARRQFVRDDFGVPAPAFGVKQGDRLALVYDPTSSAPRWELWQGSEKQQAKTWDDGRTYAAIALDAVGQPALAGQRAGFPLFETPDATDVGFVPGRLAALAWNPLAQPAGWVAVGRGTMNGTVQLLVRQSDQWFTAPAGEGEKPAAVVSTQLALNPSGALLAAGLATLRSGGEASLWLWTPAGPVGVEAVKRPLSVDAFAAAGEEGWAAVVSTEEGQVVATDAGVQPVGGLSPGERISVISVPPEARPAESSPADAPAKQ